MDVVLQGWPSGLLWRPMHSIPYHGLRTAQLSLDLNATASLGRPRMHCVDPSSQTRGPRTAKSSQVQTGMCLFGGARLSPMVAILHTCFHERSTRSNDMALEVHLHTPLVRPSPPRPRRSPIAVAPGAGSCLPTQSRRVPGVPGVTLTLPSVALEVGWGELSSSGVRRLAHGHFAIAQPPPPDKPIQRLGTE